MFLQVIQIAARFPIVPESVAPGPTSDSDGAIASSDGHLSHQAVSNVFFLNGNNNSSGSNTYSSFNVFNGGLVVGGGAFGGEQFILDSTWMDLLIPFDSHGIALEYYRRDGGFVSLLMKTVDGNMTFPSGFSFTGTAAGGTSSGDVESADQIREGGCSGRRGNRAL